MVLRMASVWTHPKTGVLWFRRAVPEKYREVLGKWEIKRSLETKDPKLAQRRFLQVAAEVSTELGALDTGPVVVDHKMLVALAGRFYREVLEQNSDEPGQPYDRDRHLRFLRDVARRPGHCADGRAIATLGYRFPALDFLRRNG